MSLSIHKNLIVIASMSIAIFSLSACSSTEIYQTTELGESNTYAWTGANSSVDLAKKLSIKNQGAIRNKEANKKKQKALIENAKRVAESDAKRLSKFEEMTKSLNDQQKAFLNNYHANLVEKADKSTLSVSKFYFAKDSKRSGKAKYQALIAKHARANGVPVNLALAVVRIESSFRANARGGAGEVGLMQVKPATARMMGYSGSTKGLYNPETNVKYGMKYLGKAHKLAKGSTCETILKYNAGHGAKRMNPISARYCKRVKSYI